MEKIVANLHKRRKRLGLSLLRYTHAFMTGYEHKRTREKCPYDKEQLAEAYWEGRRTRLNYDHLVKNEFCAEKVLTHIRR